MKNFIPALAGALASILLGGCVPKSTGPEPFYGPTESLQQLVGDVNANIEKVPTLWASGDFDASIVDHDHRTNVNGNAILMYTRPQNMLFVGKADPVGEVFKMGCGPELYWVRIKPSDTAWWGSFANLDRVDPKAIPVRPDLVEAVLGLDPLDTDLRHEPFPVLRFNNDRRAYMLVWMVRGPNRWLAQKEIWYDVDSKLPTLVNIFDADGRIVLSAYLGDHKPVDLGEAATTQSTPPMVATNYRLFFPDTGSTLRLHLSQVRLQSEGHPNAANFKFDQEKAGVSKVIPLDEPAH